MKIDSIKISVFEAERITTRFQLVKKGAGRGEGTNPGGRRRGRDQGRGCWLPGGQGSLSG
ncbi:MAG: hypothetical protein U9R48_09265 [Chloroflexota bacterium]|nr:hypothetical protein [Chloroflexota bacterium]